MDLSERKSETSDALLAYHEHLKNEMKNDPRRQIANRKFKRAIRDLSNGRISETEFKRAVSPIIRPQHNLAILRRPARTFNQIVRGVSSGRITRDIAYLLLHAFRDQTIANKVNAKQRRVAAHGMVLNQALDHTTSMVQMLSDRTIS